MFSQPYAASTLPRGGLAAGTPGAMASSAAHHRTACDRCMRQPCRLRCFGARAARICVATRLAVAVGAAGGLPAAADTSAAGTHVPEFARVWLERCF